MLRSMVFIYVSWDELKSGSDLVYPKALLAGQTGWRRICSLRIVHFMGTLGFKGFR